MRAAAIGLVAIAALVASLIAGGGHPRTARTSAPAPPARTVSQSLASRLDSAQRVIDDSSSASARLEAAGRFEQLATLELARGSIRARRSTLAALDGSAAASMRANLDAATALSALVTPRRSLPRWKIVAPPSPEKLLGYFKNTQARFGVPWEYLAAIEFVETKFGRVDGLSTAGAQGPMQFLPATWAEYGRGDVHNARAAILGAARFLVANGAPGDMAGALYHYNPSGDYVRAVEAYARRMTADRRAYYGYYYWQVIYAYARGPVILPVGYPRVRPIPVSRAG